MSKIMMSPHGLKYQVSDDVLNKLELAEIENPGFIDLVGCLAEDAEAAPHFVAYVSCICFLLLADCWWLSILSMLIGYIAGTILSHIAVVFRSSLVDAILYLYHNILMRFFIPSIAIIVIGIIINVWYSGLICTVSLYILNFIVKILFEGYRAREPFNNRISELLLNAYKMNFKEAGA